MGGVPRRSSEEALERELVVGGDHRVAAELEVLRQRAGRGQRGAVRQDARLDQAAQLLVELLVQGDRAGAVGHDAVERGAGAHGGSTDHFDLVLSEEPDCR